VSCGDVLSETADHEERVVDAEAEAKHGGQILHEDGKMPTLGEKAGNGQSGSDGNLTYSQRNQSGDQASEGEQKEHKGRGNDHAFATANIRGAGFANVEIEWDLAGEFEGDGRILGAQLVFERVGTVVKFWNEGFDGAIVGGEPDENERSATFAEEDGVAHVDVGDNAGDAGLVPEGSGDGFQGLRAGVGIGGWKTLNDQNHAVNEWRMETSGQLLRDSLCFAAFDTGCRLQMALGVKRIGKEREDSGKNNSGQPEAAQVYRIHADIGDQASYRSRSRIHLRSASTGTIESAKLVGVCVAAGGAIRTLVLLGVAAALQLGTPGLHAQDPRIGTWTLVSSQSALDPANKLSITPLKDGVHVVMSGDTHLDFTAKFDGHDVPAPGNLGFNQIELRRIDKRQSEVTEKQDGAVVATVRDKISSDGNELSVSTVSKGHADQVTVWARSGGAKVADNLFAGEWTEDVSKTRMRQGPALKIEADGGGVRFAWDYSYTARFDGKPYDLKNSRNDTVTLALVDAHTVDAVYKRDNQIAQKDRWVVSADGKQMTLTSMGTLETGQRVNEKLVFKRQ